MIDDTDRCCTADSPMSPVSRPVIQSQYCTINGRSVPSSAFNWSTDAWSASGPRMFLATLPGSTCAMTNTMTLRMNSVTRLSRILVKMKRLHVCFLLDEAGPADVGVAHRRGLHAGDVVLGP